MDAPERPLQRPQVVVDRAADYSGKKRLMRKNTLLADPQRYSHYLGPTSAGSPHDYQLLKQEFDVNLGLLDLSEVLADLSYLGLVGEYERPASSLPHRKPRRSKRQPNTRLSAAQRADNRGHARRRVRVEHALGGARRLGSVPQTCRNKAASFCDRTIALACGIWNWHLIQRLNPDEEQV